MFDRKTYSKMRRAGFVGGVSKEELSQAMLQVLLQIPIGTQPLKETVVLHLGQIGQMATTREIDEVWNRTKRKAAKLHPENFILDGRNTLQWNDRSGRQLDKNISSANFKKLNKLAEAENCSIDALISELIKTYEKERE